MGFVECVAPTALLDSAAVINMAMNAIFCLNLETRELSKNILKGNLLLVEEQTLLNFGRACFN
jgi:hypothetical protein